MKTFDDGRVWPKLFVCKWMIRRYRICLKES